MKICHITSVHPRYDIRIFIKECQALSKDFDVSLIVADSLGNERKNGVAIYDIGKPNGGRIKRMLQTSQAIYQKVLSLNPDVVHFHDPELMGIGSKLAKQGFKVIYDVHEDVPKQVLNKHWIPKFIRPIISKIVEFKDHQASSNFAGIICATEIIANRFKKYNPNTIAIHNYPILAELNQIDVEWSTRSDSLCYLGSISQTRGILPLVESLDIGKYPLELAGPFSNDIIESEINSSKGSKLVNYHGILNRGQIAELLSKVKIGVVTLLPTPSYVESLPIKLFEYMLAGIPVIASNFPLWDKYIRDNECGLMVDPNDKVAIAKAAVYLINNQEEARQMGERGRKAVINHYTWEVEARNLLTFYQNL